MSTTSPQRAVIYCRVSSRAQETEGHGLQSQETRCRQYADSKGYAIAAVFPDTFTGGGDFMQRPGMVALLSFLDAQPEQNFVVIFDDLKRFARDTRFHLDLRDAFRTRDASIECLNFRFDDSPEGEFVETIMAAQGALERKQNGRQVAQKMKARMQNGYWIHNPPIGYRYDTLKGHGKLLVPNPPFDAVIREAFDGYASGRFQAQAEVKRFFEGFPDFPRNKHGVITQQRVTDILTQPVYTGHICSKNYDINWLKAQHEALVPLDIFDKVQERRRGTAKAPRRANIGNEFALRGIVTCGSCNVPLRSSLSKGRSKHYAYYLCQTKTCDHYGKSIKRDKIEDEVGALLKELQPTEGLMAAARAMFHDIWNARTERVKEIKHSAKMTLRRLEKQKNGLVDRLVSATDHAVICAYEEKLSEIQCDQARLRDRIENQQLPAGSFDEKLEPALTFLANPWKLWESGHTAMRRLVLKLVFADRITYHRNQGPRTAEIALPFKALGVVSTPGVFCGAGEGT
ncbi:recombinase family protein [Roseobacter sp. EG26]|uniref:recombinase family protein n=1 Tax=Roseobacter sp. EG26 TaxID=3412477 RepID=UPI003CE56F7D